MIYNYLLIPLGIIMVITIFLVWEGFWDLGGTIRRFKKGEAGFWDYFTLFLVNSSFIIFVIGLVVMFFISK